MRFRNYGMAILWLVLALTVAVAQAVAQTPAPAPDPAPAPAPAPLAERQDVFAAGASYSDTGIPKAAGTVLYAHRITDGLYSFTLIDIFANPITLAPDAPAGSSSFAITTSTTTGIAQHTRDIGKVKIYVIATIGAAAGGSNIGWAYSAGGAAYIGLGKGWCLIPNLRLLKTSLSGEYQGIIGVMFGWGK